MDAINIPDTIWVLFVLGVLILILAALICYLLTMLGRVEITMRRLNRALRPEVPRDMNGRRIHQRN